MKIYYATSPFESWIEVTGIVQKPNISKKINNPSHCNVTIWDVDFALFSTWEARDHNYKIKITDDDGNQIFIGYLDSKQFLRNGITLSLVGFGSVLDGENFDGNYIKYQGTVENAFHTFSEDADEDLHANNTEAWGICFDGVYYQVLDNNAVKIFRYDDLPYGATLETDLTVHGISGPIDITSDGTYLYITDAEDNEVYKLTKSHALIDHFTPEDITTLGAITYDGENFYVFDNTDDKIKQYDSSWNKIDEFDCPGGVNKEARSLEYYNGIFYLKEQFSGRIYLLDGGREFETITYVIDTNAVGICSDQEFLWVTKSDNKAYRYFFYGVAIADTYGLDLLNNNEEAYEWETDFGVNWLYRDMKNLAILIRDTVAPEDTASFTCSDITLEGDNTSVIAGDEDSLDSDGDEDIYKYRKYLANRDPEDDAVTTATITLDGLLDKDKTIKNIRLNWKVGLYTDGIWSYEKIYFEVYNYTTESWDLVFAIGDDTATWGGKYNKSNDNYSDTDGFILSTDYLDGDEDNWTTLTFRIYNETLSDVYPNYYQVLIDYLVVEIDYDSQYFSPIMKRIWGNGESYIVSDFNWTDSGVASSNAWMIGENTYKVLNDIFGTGTSVNFRVLSTLSKYVARKYIGDKRIGALNSICNIEGLSWTENHLNEEILLFKKDDAEDSTVALTTADIAGNIQYLDEVNHFKEVIVYGNEELGIINNRVYNDTEGKYTYDPASTSKKVKIIQDSSIFTVPDATEVAMEQFAIWRYKQPSIIVNTNKTYYDIDAGQTVNLTVADLNISDIDYIVRRITVEHLGYNSDGDEILQNTMYLGLGSTPLDEKKDNLFRELKLAVNNIYSTNRLNSQVTQGTLSLSSNDISDFTAAVQALVEAYNYLQNVIEDTSPELGGNLDANDKAISNIKTLAFNDGGATVDIIRDEDAMGSNDANALATQQSIKAYVDNMVSGSGALIETGTYTGDGSLSKDIILGYRPAFLLIYRHYVANNNAESTWIIIDEGGVAHLSENNDAYMRDRLTIIATGFNVDDDGGNENPNENACVYDYVAFH